MTRKIRITRRSKLGYGYNAGWTRTRQGEDILPLPKKPDHTGTIAQISAAMEADREFQSYQSGTYYASCYFARYRGQWKRILTPNWQWDLYHYPAQWVEIE